MGIGVGGEIPLAFTLLAEFLPARLRTRTEMVLGILAIVLGYAFSAISAHFLLPVAGWKSLFYVQALPALLVVIVRFRFPESPRYLLSAGKEDEARRVAAEIRRQTGGTYDPLDEAQADLPREDKRVSLVEGVGRLWRNIDFWLGILTTFLVALAWCTNLVAKPLATAFGGGVALIGMGVALTNYRLSKKQGRLPVAVATGVEGRIPGSVLAVLSAENGRNDAIIRTAVDIADDKLIAAKTASGEADLQARYLSFDDYTILKDGEDRGHYHVRLWDDGRGSNLTLYPNLTTNDPMWRQMMRDLRFRHALSLAIDRHEINQAIYFGLGQEGANTVLGHSPMYSPEISKMWSTYDPDQANALLDQMGLTQRDEDGIRLLPDGRPMQIIVDTADAGSEQSDVLELIAECWKQIGISMFIKPSQLEVFRNRIFAGDSIMSMSNGVDNSFPTPDMSPAEFAPSTQQQLMWPKWGQYIETGGKSGEKVDLPAARQLADWLQDWRMSPDPAQRLNIWFEILHVWAEQVFTIGIVSNVPQPVVVSDHLHNVPEKAIFAWDPGADFGLFKPDTFWVDNERPLSPVPGSN